MSSKGQDDGFKTTKSVHLVVQRYRSCRLLVDETDWRRVGQQRTDEGDDQPDAANRHCGLVVYVSFSPAATVGKVDQAVSILLNLPVATTGEWGDASSSTLSILDLAAEGERQGRGPAASVVVVPQANLICKVKNVGKSIQYHGQMDKDKSVELYAYFCDSLRLQVLERQCTVREEELPEWCTPFVAARQHSENNKPAIVSPSTPPEQLFRQSDAASRYSSWDETGMPVSDANGNALTKSALKKLKKQYDAHCKRHTKWTTQQEKQQQQEPPEGNDRSAAVQDRIASTDTIVEASVCAHQWEDVSNSFCPVLVGSFGKRQGLELQSDMGPFCHVFQV